MALILTTIGFLHGVSYALEYKSPGRSNTGQKIWRTISVKIPLSYIARIPHLLPDACLSTCQTLSLQWMAGCRSEEILCF